MVNYSITDLEKITGIKAHTIRIWEKRYRVVTPERTTTNIRYYSDNDLKRLLNISMLNRYGYRISSIVKMSTDELSKKVMDISESSNDYNLQIEHLIVSMMELNEEKFEKVLSNALIKLGFENAVTGIIYPFLEKVGILWLVGTINPAQEHFIVNLIRQKIIAAIDGLMVTPSPEAKKFILFLPPGELHELSLLFSWYMLKKHGHKVLYFGQSLPIEDLKKVSQIQAPDYMLTVITAAQTNEQYLYLINTLSRGLPDVVIFITGLQTREHLISLPENIILLENPSDIPDFISV
ncbi:MAG: MerR family transcriptional regulator [Bacteroidales bacterium]|nr:MerR family transcriptional regulator [Bacteroidales bacterium]